MTPSMSMSFYLRLPFMTGTSNSRWVPMLIKCLESSCNKRAMSQGNNQMPCAHYERGPNLPKLLTLRALEC